MDREPIGYTEGEFAYFEFANGERYRFKPTSNKSTQKLEKAKNAYTLTKDELKWIRQVLSDYDPSKIEISPSYFYKKKTEYVRNANKGNVRKELDDLRDKLMKVTPQELLELRSKTERERRGIDDFSGIYIIHNGVRDMYYIGQSSKVINRAYQLASLVDKLFRRKPLVLP